VLPFGQKVTLRLLATLEVVPFRVYAPFAKLLLFLKFIMEVVFYEDVQHRLRFCLDRINCLKMAAFKFL
jgi:hypothetical protein